MRLTRRKFLATLGAGALVAGGAGIYGYFVETHAFEVTRKKVSVARLPTASASTPIRLLHLSDFHASPVVSLAMIETAIDIGLAEKPDIICVTGDFITSTLENESAYATVLRKLSAHAPTFASPGNHDGGFWASKYGHGYADVDRVRRLLDASGIEFLVNARREIRVRDRPLILAGLGDLWALQLSPQNTLYQMPDPSRATIVLSHNPDSKIALAGFAWDLMLCGHTHGGQFRVPFTNIRPFLPVKDKTMAEGLHTWRDRQVHITRGVGNLHGLRFNCPPEVSVIDLAV